MRLLQSQRLRDPGLWLYCLVILGVAFGFQGSRGLGEPDETRYAHAALEMLDHGDWQVPRLHGMVYLDKPPLVYWSIAAGTGILGRNEWGARLGHALAFAATAFLVGAWAGRAWGREAGRLAGLVYATTMLPAVAANLLTPDTLLALWTTATAYAYWRYLTSPTDRDRWLWALAGGSFLGLGLLTKGPAALVFLAPVGLHLLWKHGPWRVVLRPELWVAGLMAATIGLWWYVAVAENLPGAASYFFDNQVAGRLWKESYGRNEEWWRPLTVYGVSLGFGSLPWSLVWLRRLWRRDSPSAWRTLWRDPLGPFLVLAIAVPLAVLCVARSRLPLYALPILPYLALATARIARISPDPRRWRRRAIWAALALVALKWFASVIPISRDSRALARTLVESGVARADCVDALGTKAHGLAFYGFTRVSWHTLWPESYPYFERPRNPTADLRSTLDSCGGRIRFLTQTRDRGAIEGFLDARGLDCTRLQPSSDRDLFDCRLATGVPS